MKKIFAIFVAFILVCGQAFPETFYFWRYREHATDCTSLTDGKARDLCYEVDDQTFYKCAPSAGDCNTVGEWKALNANAVETDPYFDSKFSAKSTTNLSEGTNQYFTNARARGAISETVTGLGYDSGTGVISLTSGYVIPTTAKETNWDTAFGWGNHASAGYLTAESDPQVGSLTNNKWCKSDGSAVVCDQNEPTGGVWGQITGTLSNQTDLQSALDGKQDDITTGTTGQYFRGDLSLATFPTIPTPAGSTGQIQYNNAGSFGALSFLYPDTSTNAFGFQVSPVGSAVHVGAVAGTTINNVTIGSLTLEEATSPSAPTGSITKIAEPSAPASGSISFIDQGSGGLSANGTTYYFNIYPCIDSGSVCYKSANYYSMSSTDPNDSDYYNVSADWDDVTVSGEDVDYFVEVSTDGGSYAPLGVQDTSSVTYSGSTSSDPTQTFPTYYQNSGGTPPSAPTSFDTAGQQYDGSMSYYYANGQTIKYEIDQYKTIGGTDYVSGSPVQYNSGSGFTDDNSGNYYYVDVTWTFGGATYDGVILRKSTDGGSSWTYIKLPQGSYNGTFSDYNFSDDGSGSSWGNTYSAGAITYYFDAYGKATSPSNSTIYSASPNTYNTSVPADGIKYLFKHAFTGIPAGGAKVVAPSGSASYGVDISASPYYDAGYTTWGGGTTVTPTTYAFTSGSRQYSIYSYSSTLLIYGATPLTLNSGTITGSKYVSLSWTLPSGVTTVKITRGLNGGGHSVSKTITGTSVTDDATDSSWGGNTTVTPTSVVGIGVRIDKSLISSSTGQPHLALVETTGSGNRYVRQSFGFANSMASEPTYLAHIQVDSATGYVDWVTGRMNLASSLNGTPSVILGNANIFNNASSSTVHFQVKGQNDAYLINTRSDQNTVGFGQQIGTDESATVQIHPARSEPALVLKGFTGYSTTSPIVRGQSNDGSYYWYITLGGHFQGGAGSTSNPAFSFYSDSNTGIYNATTDALGFVTGGSERGRVNSSGDFGFGATGTISARAHIIKTTEQLRVGYDTSNYYSTTIGATGIVTLDAVGAGSKFVFSDNVDISTKNIITDTTTGTKFGSSTTMKFGWWNATPVVQNTGWSVTGGYSTDKDFNPEATTVTELARVVGTIVDTLKTYGLLGA